LAIEGGSVEVANCASCHGTHNIKPSSDSTSTVNKKNLAKTCGGCHKGANENFAIGKVHITRQEKSEPIIYTIATMYIILISVTIGGMFIHNLLDFFRKSKIRKMKQRGLMVQETHGHSLYLRMTVNERIQHISLALSFILLVITGFMLSYPNAWWVSHIRDLSSDVFEYRSILHRISAVVMVTVSLYHIFYISATTRGRQLVKDLFPRLQDFKDAIGIAMFNLGISKEKPKLDRFSYVEKAEYWALVWGTIVMTATGIIMWFDNTFMGLFTKLGWDIARTIHYYEAWLAFLAIVVWHFYFVIFNPDVYPMNLAWWKGTISEEEMAEEHPLEYERLNKKNINLDDE
jgi:cytochrome b subunit of formate dehydrogenase